MDTYYELNLEHDTISLLAKGIVYVFSKNDLDFYERN